LKNFEKIIGKDPGPEGPALVHAGFRLVEPIARKEGWYGWLPLPAVFPASASLQTGSSTGPKDQVFGI